MRLPAITCLAFSLGSCTLLAACGGSTSLSVPRVYDFTQTGSTLDSYVAPSGSNTVTGYSFILFDRSGTLYSRAGGDRTIEAVRALASGTKLPSVIAIVSLVDSGLITLDAPVAQYLAQDPTFTWPADKAAITMRMLLAHTSGLVGLNDNQPHCLNLPTGTILRDCAQVIAGTDLVAQPGTAFNYGGADFQVAGYIATLLTGQTWQTLFAARGGTPLGLTAFTYGDSTITNPRIAAGAFSNVGDYARILRMVQNDGVLDSTRVLSSAIDGEIKRNHIAGLPVLYAPFPAGRSGNYPGYGLSLFISATSLHPGSKGPEYSDPGLFGMVPWFDDALGYGAVLLTTDGLVTGLNR